MKVKEFSYTLPPERIATEPADPRDAARLLLLERGGGGPRDESIRNLPELLEPGDLLVVNDTKVLPARLFGRRSTGGKVEFLFLRVDRALVKAHRRLRPGEVVETDGGLLVELLEKDGAIWRVRADGDLPATLEEHGHMPLPPYIKRDDHAGDREHYQTMFADQPGSAAAPTAGLHFTPDLVDRLAARGVGMTRVTLHVGYGTFQPLDEDLKNVEEHRLHAEEFEVTEAAVEAIESRKGRLIAVGTTTTRVLESLARTGGLRAARGSTDLFLYPGQEFRLVEGLLTNFHLPESSLLMLVCAFGGTESVLAAYAHAVDSGYRFYSYGDAMLLLGQGR